MPAIDNCIGSACGHLSCICQLTRVPLDQYQSRQQCKPAMLTCRSSSRAASLAWNASCRDATSAACFLARSSSLPLPSRTCPEAVGGVGGSDAIWDTCTCGERHLSSMLQPGLPTSGQAGLGRPLVEIRPQQHAAWEDSPACHHCQRHTLKRLPVLEGNDAIKDTCTCRERHLSCMLATRSAQEQPGQARKAHSRDPISAACCVATSSSLSSLSKACPKAAGGVGGSDAMLTPAQVVFAISSAY